MTRMKLLTAVAVLTAAWLGVQGASAQDVVHFIGAGSSAQYQALAMAAVNDLAPNTTTVTGGGSIHHWTYKSACPGSTCITVLKDPRTNSSTGPIPNEPTTVWIVWTCPAGGCTGAAPGLAQDIWVYHQVDSTVGVRSFLGRPNGCASPCNTAASLSLITSDVKGSNTAFAGINNVSPTLFTAGVASWGAGDTSCPGADTTCDDEFVPADVWTAISSTGGVAITAGATDITPEDAKAATKRANGPATNNVSLGYGTVGSQLIGAAIQSHFSATTANPIEFGMPGLPDPFNNVTVPTTIKVIPVGQSPIVFITNRKNASGLGAPDTIIGGGAFAYSDLEDGKGPVATSTANPLSDLFSGVDCSGKANVFYDQAGNVSFTASALGANFPVINIQREPLSGTMNTTEWSVFRTANVIANVSNPNYAHIAGAAGGPSQEYNVQASAGGTNNPLNLPCQNLTGAQGTRQRAIGTGELVNNVFATNDSIGYTFFSFGNVSKLAGGGASYGYLTLDRVDPIFASYTGSEPGQQPNGALPKCTPPACTETAIWNNPTGSFPNLRNGTYRAWSLLRLICDTANTHCLASSDAFGAQALSAAFQTDISGNSANSVADFLPYNQIQYIRAHYNVVPGAEHADPFAYYFDWPGVGSLGTLTLGVPAVGTSPASGVDAEQGGDAGGCIIPINAASPGSSGRNWNDTSLQVTAATTASAGKTVYSYTNLGGTTLALGTSTTGLFLQVWGFTNAGNNGVFPVTGISNLKITVTNAGGVAETIAAPFTAPNGAAGNGSGVAGVTPTTCYQ